MCGWAVLLVVVLAAATAAACGGKSLDAKPGEQADKYLFDRGNEEVGKKSWVKARTYYQRLVDGYLAGLDPRLLAKASQVVNSGFAAPILDIGF